MSWKDKIRVIPGIIAKDANSYNEKDFVKWVKGILIPELEEFKVIVEENKGYNVYVNEKFNSRVVNCNIFHLSEQVNHINFCHNGDKVIISIENLGVNNDRVNQLVKDEGVLFSELTRVEINKLLLLFIPSKNIIPLVENNIEIMKEFGRIRKEVIIPTVNELEKELSHSKIYLTLEENDSYIKIIFSRSFIDEVNSKPIAQIVFRNNTVEIDKLFGENFYELEKVFIVDNSEDGSNMLIIIEREANIGLKNVKKKNISISNITSEEVGNLFIECLEDFEKRFNLSII